MIYPAGILRKTSLISLWIIYQTIKNVVDLYSINAKNKCINLILDLPDSLYITYDKKWWKNDCRNRIGKGEYFFFYDSERDSIRLKYYIRQEKISC